MKCLGFALLLALATVIAAQYEEDVREGGPLKLNNKSEWFWESSTTTTSAPSSSPESTTFHTESTSPIPSQDNRNETDSAFKPANATSGRSSKALNLDLLGNVREGRIMNDDPGNRKISLQGFIPIVSFSERDDESDSSARKSPKRDQDELYYEGPYPPQPIEDDKETKGYNTRDYLLSDSTYKKPDDDSSYGTRIENAGKQFDSERLKSFYIPPPPPPSYESNRNLNKNVRFVDTSTDYNNRKNKQNHFDPDVKKTESAQSGHFSILSKPDDIQYAPAVPYVPDNDGSKDTTAKQFRPGHKQFEAYEFNGGNYGLGNENALGDEDQCICVPFYLCRNGYLVNGRSQGPVEPIDERSARKISRRSISNQTSSGNDTYEIPHYTADVMARMVGLSNVGHSCGLLRRCCKSLPNASPGGLLPFSPDNYPIPHPIDVSQLPPGIFPQDFQNQPHRPPHHEEEQVYIVNDPNYPRPSPHQEHVIVVPQEVHPNRRPKPVYQPPYRKPVRPIVPNRGPQYLPPPPPPQRPIHQKPHHRPVYPKPQQGYPQPVYPQPAPHPVYPQPAYPQPSPQPAYQPDYSHPKPQFNQGQCGARNGLGIHGRVKNLQYQDDASEFGEYPWQAAILLKVGPGNNLFVCGGTLISSNWVATAAHCLKKHQADELKVRLGDWDVHRDDEFYPYVEKYVTEVVPHPEFYPGNLQNDIALLRLESHVDPSQPHISPACLPEPHETFDNQRCWVTGWGKNAFGEQGEYQSVLKEVDVPVVSHRDCENRLKQTRLGHHYQLHPGFVCAGGEPGKDACTGDGGSPLVCESHGTWKVAGLVSWGIGCGQPGVPGIYVSMAKYRTWIETIVTRYG